MKNLTENRDVTAALLLEPLQWRVRVVEEIVVDAATTCLRTRSLQAAPLRPLIESHVSPADTQVLIALNVAPMPRGPLLDFTIEGPLGDAWLLPRMEIAQRQARYLTAVAMRAGIRVTGRQNRILTRVLGFSETGWLYGSDGFSLADYLEDGLGTSVTARVLEEWAAINTSCKRLLRPLLDMPVQYTVCESPALAIPDLYPADVPFDEDDATKYLREYLRLLQKMLTMVDSSPFAGEFLRALADYGTHYDMIVAVKVPVDEPFVIKYTERRSLTLHPLRRTGSQILVIADAQSNHVTFKISDPNVRIADFAALEPAKDEFAFGSFLSKSDDQTRSFYAHDTDRDYRVRLKFKLALLRRLQGVPYLASLLIFLLSMVLMREPTKDLRTLGLIVGPSALAASVLLAREPSTLGSRLRLASTLVLAGSVLFLLCATVVSYLRGTIPS
ncbi:hypothetical protein [Mycobacterium sp. IS-1742]|uniref:hypothetical protein n=1 Tax=Mycobacterium sp. IS-1742 TaxID=1772285 RepID=UPI0012F82740|nr:hypothetical protein [Mycobacterium sp. IS-1742]